jgi:hypothetical protein
MLRDLSDADKHRLLTRVMIPTTGLAIAHSAMYYFLGDFVLASAKAIRTDPGRFLTR